MPARARPTTTTPRAARVTGRVSVEALHHFQCGDCRKWWSIGDAPRRTRWYCPWCGRENETRVARR